MNRLHPDVLNALPTAVQRPAYDRGGLANGIVHLGVGAFHRAHQAVVNEAALQAGGDAAWGLVGVSLRHADTRDALAPQAGLYTVALRDADDDGQPRERLQVVGCLRQLLVAPEDPLAVLEHIAAPQTRIVSLTVTKQGYHQVPSTGRLKLDDDAVRHDLANPSAPRTAIGFIAHGLQLRRQRHRPPITVLSCDDLPSNGRALERLVLAFARELDPQLTEWIALNCAFPCAMVDRIVPRTTDADRARIGALLGVEDAWPVLGEPFLDWVIEDHFANGRPAWEHGGARFVDDVAPFELARLRLLDGSQSALAYLGSMAGLQTVDEALARPELKRFAEALMHQDIVPGLPAADGLDPADYARRILARCANPALRHALRPIAMDGSQKLPPRLLDTARARLQAGAPIERLALAVAAWLHYQRGEDETGARYAIDDPLAPRLAALLAADASPAAGLAFEPVFGALGREPAFVEPVSRQLQSLRDIGTMATVAAAP